MVPQNNVLLTNMDVTEETRVVIIKAMVARVKSPELQYEVLHMVDMEGIEGMTQIWVSMFYVVRLMSGIR